jgi:hypothetical protein
VNYENYRVLFIIVGLERIGMRGEPFKKPCEIPAEIRLKALKSETGGKMEIWRSSPTPTRHYFSDALATGTDYRVTLIVNGSVKASLVNVRGGAEKPAELSFYLRPEQISDKHMVRIPDEPAGTPHWHEPLGGGG